MTKTRSQLVLRALQKMKVARAGTAPASEDTQLVDGVVDAVMSSLMRREIFTWGDDNAYPDEAFEHLADCIAHVAAPDFSKTYNPDPNDSSPMPERFEKRLRALEPYQLSYQPQQTEYY